MKKLKKRPNATVFYRRIGKLLDEAYDIQPNLFKFLIDKGIKAEIAEEAQELVVEHWLDATNFICGVLHDPVTKMLLIHHSIGAKLEEIEQELGEFPE